MNRRFFILALFVWILGNIPSSAQTVTLLHNFTNSPDGANPVAGLLLAGGRLYGTTEKGGPASDGLVFAVNTDSSGFSILHNFTGSPDGSHSPAGLILSGSMLYGVTANGGTSNYGSIFALSTNGDTDGYQVLYNFVPQSNGALPNATLTLSGNTLYGIAAGDGDGIPGWGTIFSIETNGSNFTALYNFTTPHGDPLVNTDGEQPQSQPVLAAGTLYGTAYGGGMYGYGTVYSVQTNGSNFTVLHAFTNAPDGAYLQGGVVLAGNTLYGTTDIGGANGKGTIFSINTNGSGYQVLHTFLANGVDGIDPYATMTVLGSTLYGTTRVGGSSGRGTVFSINTNGGAYIILYNFTNTPDGANPESQPVVAGNTLYGATESGGRTEWGAVFSLALPVLEISSVSIAGSNLILDGENGVSGASYAVLASTNLMLPLSQWTPVATNILTTNGNFTLTATNVIRSGTPQQFYILQPQ